MIKFLTQGNLVVVRDGDKLVKNKEGKPIVAVVPKRAPVETLRKALAKLTNNGRDLLVNHLNLANGIPFQQRLPDGSCTEWEVPTAETRRAANLDLLHFGHGKPVAQTEVMKAESEAEDMEQYRALSDAQLHAIIEGEARELPDDTSDDSTRDDE